MMPSTRSSPFHMVAPLKTGAVVVHEACSIRHVNRALPRAPALHEFLIHDLFYCVIAGEPHQIDDVSRETLALARKPADAGMRPDRIGNAKNIRLFHVKQSAEHGLLNTGRRKSIGEIDRQKWIARKSCTTVGGSIKSKTKTGEISRGKSAREIARRRSCWGPSRFQRASATGPAQLRLSPSALAP